MTPPPSSWRRPPLDLSLAPDEVHLWRAALDRPESDIARLWPTLTLDEQERSGRLRFERDRGRFIASRGILRAILARYVGTAPAALAFTYGPRGKPAFAASSASAPHVAALRFNMAHSQGLALFAVTLERAIGVDLEQIHPIEDATRIAERFFAPAERTALRILPPEQQLDAFFACWTRKEAYLKATGDGLARPLNTFAVSLAPTEPVRLLHVADAPDESARWRLEALTPALGYVAALAVAGHDWRLACWEWRA
jgi:4'-phosphopantetheinyl transferase